MGEHPAGPPELPALLEANEPGFEHWGAVKRSLSEGWSARGRARRRIEGVIGLALDFSTWRTLVRSEGLTDDEVVELFVRSIRCLADSSHRVP